MRQDETVKIRCPKCGRYLGEGKSFIRVVCRDCSGEITYRSKEDRSSSNNGRVIALTSG